jgi:sec-independent protein translocase protein TatC
MSLVLQLSKAARPQHMSFVDHLEVLRGHIIRSLLAVLITSIALFIFRDWFFDTIITGPLHADFITYQIFCKLSHFLHAGDNLCLPPIEVSMQTTSFSGQFVSSITMAFAGGFIVAFPYICWEFWQFIKPALHDNEKKNSHFAILGISSFFLLGALFGYLVLSPFTFNFLASYQLGTNMQLVTHPTLNDYLENLVSLVLGCGLAFELPVVAYSLTKLGVITPGMLRSSRKYAYIVILILAAIITPSPDWLSQVIVFIPLLLLYELSIIISTKVYRITEAKLG